MKLPHTPQVHLAGLLIILASLAHTPVTWNVLNCFDVPKRLVWAIAALALAVLWPRGKGRYDMASMIAAVFLFAWIAARSLFRPQPDAELEVLFTWLMPVLLFILACGTDRARGGRFLGACLVVAGLVQAGLMLLQRAGFDPIFAPTTTAMAYKPGRMIGTIGYQNQAVDFLAMTVPGIFMITRSRPWRAVYIALMLVVAGLTGNRGGILAFMAAIAASYGVQALSRSSTDSRKRFVVVLAGCAAVAIGILLFVPETGGRFRELVTNARHSQSLVSRVRMAEVGLDMMRERPLAGWGAGEYALQYIDRLGHRLNAVKTHEDLLGALYAREAHNDFIQFAAEFGLVGVLAALALAAAGFRRFRAAKRDGPLPESGALSFVIAYMAVSGLFSFPWQVSMAGPLAGFLAGRLWSRRAVEGEPAADSPSLPRMAGGVVMRVFLVFAAALLVVWNWTDARLNRAVPEAIDAGRQAVDGLRLPSWAYRYHAIVGAAYAAEGSHDDALRVLRHAEKGFHDVQLLNNLGHTLARLGKWEEASAVYEKWASCGIMHSNALINLSVAYEQTGRIKEAAAALGQKLTLWPPAGAEEVKRLAVLQLQTGDPKSAQATLDMHRGALESAEPRMAAEMINLQGAVFMSLGDTEKAGQCFRAALEKAPDLDSARRNLEGLERQQQAVSDDGDKGNTAR